MALLRHSGIYFLARILAGGASFAIIAAYTRLLDPHAFGELAMQRYLPGQSEAARAAALDTVHPQLYLSAALDFVRLKTYAQKIPKKLGSMLRARLPWLLKSPEP